MALEAGRHLSLQVSLRFLLNFGQTYDAALVNAKMRSVAGMWRRSRHCGNSAVPPIPTSQVESEP